MNMRDLEDFISKSEVRQDLADLIDYIAGLCALNAESKGFHEDEEVVREILKGHPKQLEWFEAQILQAELGRQASEIGEAIEAVRKPGVDHHCPQFSNFEIEQADVIIRVFDTCAKRKLNIGRALVAKLAYNASRPHKHGKNS